MATPKKNEPTQSTAIAIPGAGISEEHELALTRRDTPVQFLQLMQGKSGPVEENEPQGIRAGDYLLGGRTRIPGYREGPGFRCIVGVSRPSAVLFENNEKKIETHDEKSPEWATVASKKATNDKGAKLGLDLLLWLPDFETFAILGFMNNAREEAQPALACRKAKQVAQVTSKLVGKKNAFFVPSVAPCKTQEIVKMPTEEQAKAALAIFESYKNEKSAPVAEGARPR